MKPKQTSNLLAVTSKDLTQPIHTNLTQIQLLYRIDQNLNLLQSASIPQNIRRKNQIMGIHCQIPSPNATEQSINLLTHQILTQATKHQYQAIALFLPSHTIPLLHKTVHLLEQTTLSHALPLYTPETYAKDTTHGKIFLSTALSGGTLNTLFQKAIQKYSANRLIMDIECMSHDFLLPAPKGTGEKRTHPEIQTLIHREKPSIFFSKELCSQYFTYQNTENSLRFVLFDDQTTIKEKIHLANKWHLHATLLTYSEIKHLHLF